MITIPPFITPLSLPMPATLGSVNVYLVRGARGAALVDTGMDDTTSVRDLEAQLAAEGLALADIREVAFTHHHVDHAGLGRTFQEIGARTFMSRVDADSLKIFFARPELDRDRATFFGRHAVPETFAERVAPMFPFFRSLAQRFEPTDLLTDGEVVDLAGIGFEVLATPGHTPGHVCLRHGDLLLTGDCVTGSDATHISMRPEVIGSNPLEGFLASLGRLRPLEIGVTLPGHGPPIRDLKRRITAIEAHHETRLGQVLAALGDEPRGAFDLSVEALGPRPKSFARWLAMSQTLAYLEYLVQNGRALEREEGGLSVYLRKEG
jgi:glyoxylase-like metal-dependent hydrolase (beta-lactamase superfamily II)